MAHNLLSSTATLYYWVGGAESGSWHECRPTLRTREGFNAHRKEIELMGYACIEGSTIVGPPDGPPR